MAIVAVIIVLVVFIVIVVLRLALVLVLVAAVALIMASIVGVLFATLALTAGMLDVGATIRMSALGVCNSSGCGTCGQEGDEGLQRPLVLSRHFGRSNLP